MSPECQDTFRHVRPKVPVRPTWGRIRAPHSADMQVSAVIDLPSVSWFTNGRTALAHAASLSGIKAGDGVLVPAYHCESMIEPFSWLGAELSAYRIRGDLSIDLDDIIAVHKGGVRAILAPQYFGHIRSLETVSRLAAEHGWTVIEDCAHAFFNVGETPLMGVHSDYVVASLPKFFPVLDGGILASRRHHVSQIQTGRVGARDEIRGIVDMAEYAAEYGRRSWATDTLGAALSVARHLRRSAPTNAPARDLPASRHGGVAFEPEHLGLSACALSKAWPYMVQRRSHALARRSNWTVIRNAVRDLPGIRLPIDELAASDVPYVFAMEVENGEAVYPELRRSGVPAYRWETRHAGIVESRCANSERFLSDLVQLPCHQSLTPDELGWIIESVVRVVRANA